jgi:lysozyme
MDWLAICEPFVKHWEGCRLTAYKDGGGVWTIGYGDTGILITDGVTWTQERADARLSVRLRYEFGPQVDKALNRKPTAHQKAAMTSFAYNIGSQNFADSTLVRLFNLGDNVAAESQFARWNHDNGKVVAGLTNRRAAEAALFRTPDA